MMAVYVIVSVIARKVHGPPPMGSLLIFQLTFPQVVRNEFIQTSMLKLIQA